jgi:hypothetical protein
MSNGLGRRDFLRRMTALGAAGVPALSTWWSIPAHAGGATGGASMKAAYDPAGKFDIKVSEVEFRRAVRDFGEKGHPWVLFYFNEPPPPPKSAAVPETFSMLNLSTVGSMIWKVRWVPSPCTMTLGSNRFSWT